MNGAYIPEYWDDVRTVGAATNIVVGESATVTAKNAELAPASRISGKVTGRDGAGLADVSVNAYTKRPGQDYWGIVDGGYASTGPDGTYVIGGLPAGTYRIGFRDWRGRHLEEYWDDAATLDDATDIVLGAAETAQGTDAELATGSNVTGRVTGPDGNPLANVNVAAYTKSPGDDYWSMVSMGVSTRPDGTYDLGGLRAGTYRIGFDSYLGWLHAGVLGRRRHGGDGHGHRARRLQHRDEPGRPARCRQPHHRDGHRAGRPRRRRA